MYWYTEERPPVIEGLRFLGPERQEQNRDAFWGKIKQNAYKGTIARDARGAPELTTDRTRERQPTTASHRLRSFSFFLLSVLSYCVFTSGFWVGIFFL